MRRIDETVDVSVIIVSWNVADLLKACLESIYTNATALSLEVIVVDSASSDETVEMIRRDFPQVILRAMGENVGFPKGNNLGIEVARGRYLFHLNPDTVIIKDALQTMVAYLDAHPTVGLVGSQLRFPDGTIQSSRRRFPTPLTGLFESTWLENYAPRSILDRYYVADRPDDAISEVDWVMGASMLVRQEVIEQVGGMDVDYFMYSEELDWCRRIKTAGWGIVYLPTAQIIHYQGASSEQASTARHINFNRAKLRYFRKYHGPLVSGLIRTVLLTNYVAQVMVEAIKWGVGHKRALRRQRISAYSQVIRSGLRPAGY